MSAKKAYLANRARHELDKNKELSGDWISDFGSLAFGDDWEDEIKNPENVKKKADKLWEKSQFEQPLTKIIHAANESASTYAVKSATEKLKKYAEEVNRHLALRLGLLSKTKAELSDALKKFQEDKQLIDSIGSKAGKTAQHRLEGLLDDFMTLSKDAEQAAMEALEVYFKGGKSVEIINPGKDVVSASDHEKTAIGSVIGWIKARSGSGKDFDPQKQKIEFSDKREANEFLSKIHQSVTNILLQLEKDVQASMKGKIIAFQEICSSDVSRLVQDVLDKTNKQLDADGISVVLTQPQIQWPSMKLGVGGMENLLKKKSKEVRRTYVKDSFFAKTLNWLNSECDLPPICVPFLS